MFLLNGDCLEQLKLLPDSSIDLVLCDPPYGTTACKWDSIIPLDKMWSEINRVAKENAAILLFGQNPFTAQLIMSNLKDYRYDIVWEKDQAKNFFFMKKQIGKIHELISVFYRRQPIYNPQMQSGFKPATTGSPNLVVTHNLLKAKKGNRGGATDRFPTSVQKFSSIKKAVHPTQKPVDLLEFLIKSYTNSGDTVLDFTMGSGSTGVACVNTNRDFIGIELDQKYFEIAEKRIAEAYEKKSA